MELSDSCFPEDVEVELHAETRRSQAAMVTVALHKPIGWVSSQPEHDHLPAAQLLTLENYWKYPSERPHVVPRFLPKMAVVGRLDKDSRGLLLFSQDGRLAKQVIGEQSELEKEYLVTVDGAITPHALDLLRHGLYLDGELPRTSAPGYNLTAPHRR